MGAQETSASTMDATAPISVRCSDWLDAIVCADCLNEMAKMPDKSVDVIITDPPYEMTSCKWDKGTAWESWWNQAWRITKTRIVMTAANPFAAEMIQAQREKYSHDWVWDKSWATGAQNSMRMPMRAHELVLVFGNGIYNPQMVELKPDEIARMRKHDAVAKTAGILGDDRTNTIRGWYDGRKKHPTTVLGIKALPAMSKERAGHPTQKPVTLMAYLVRTYTNHGDTVLDPFCGSGTTCIAASQEGRHYIGIEKETKYAKIAKQRIYEARGLGV